jgi:hypothetical protein
LLRFSSFGLIETFCPVFGMSVEKKSHLTHVFTLAQAALFTLFVKSSA